MSQWKEVAWRPMERKYADKLEQEADALLDAAARAQGGIVRDWGILDRRRQEKVTNWESSLDEHKARRKSYLQHE